MKVFFDNKIFFIQKYGGVSRYYFNLCKGLENLGVDCFISSPINYNEYLKRDSLKSKIHFLGGVSTLLCVLFCSLFV